MRTQRLIGLIFIAGTILFSKDIMAQENGFQAGASISEITPFLGASIVGNYNSPPATYIHDPLNARTLVLDDGKQKLIFVIVDNVGIDQEVFDAAKQLVQNDLGIPGENIMMAATHTHSGVSLGGQGIKRKDWGLDLEFDDYQIFVVKRIVDGIKVALENRLPAKIAFGSVDIEEHVFNRRWIMRDSVLNPFGLKDIAKMNPGHSKDLVRPAGPVDPEVSFIAVESLEGNPIALLANYSLHYVGGVPKGHISADYFAAFANRMSELLGTGTDSPPFVGIMTNGTSGDVNNNDYSKPSSGKTWLPYEKIQYVANDIAQKVFAKYRKLDFDTDVRLRSAQSEMALAVRRASPEMLRNVAMIRDNKNPEPLFHPLEKTYAHWIFQMEYEYPDSVNVILQSFAINDIGIASLPFEAFAQIGLDIKAQSPFKNTFTIELANGSFGYLPTPEQHKLGGYESWLGINQVQEDASDRIAEQLIKQLNQLK